MKSLCDPMVCCYDAVRDIAACAFFAHRLILTFRRFVFQSARSRIQETFLGLSQKANSVQKLKKKPHIDSFACHFVFLAKPLKYGFCKQ